MATKRKIYVYIDESGSLADDRPFFVVAFVCQTHHRAAWGIMKKARQKVLHSTKPLVPREIKFNNSTESLRRFVLERLSTKAIKIYVWVIDKEGRKIAETPQNFAAILNYALRHLPRASSTLITIDRKFTKKYQLKTFGAHFRFAEQARFEDSRRRESLQLADFVAGAFGAKYNLGNKSFTDLIECLIAKEAVVKWTKVKKETLEPTGGPTPPTFLKRKVEIRLGHHSGGPTSPWTYSSASPL